MFSFRFQIWLWEFSELLWNTFNVLKQTMHALLRWYVPVALVGWIYTWMHLYIRRSERAICSTCQIFSFTLQYVRSQTIKCAGFYLCFRRFILKICYTFLVCCILSAKNSVKLILHAKYPNGQRFELMKAGYSCFFIDYHFTVKAQSTRFYTDLCLSQVKTKLFMTNWNPRAKHAFKFSISGTQCLAPAYALA